MKIKKIISSAVAVSLLLSFAAGCGQNGDSASKDGKVTITVGNWPNQEANPKQYENLEKMRTEFLEKNPHIDLKTDEFTYDTQVFLARAEGGTLPTLYATHFTESDMLIKNEYVADITDELKERGWIDKMTEYLLGESSKDGRMYLLSENCYTLGLMINLDLFEQAGLLGEDGTPVIPETYEELAQISKTITEKTGKAGFVIPTKQNMGGWFFSMLGWAFGVDYMEQIDGKWTATFDSQEMIDALNYIKDLKWNKKTMPENALIGYEDMLQLVATGEAAMAFGHPAAISGLNVSYNMNKDSIGYAKIPAGPKGRYTLMGGGYYAIRPDATKEQIKACFDWIEFRGHTPDITDEQLARYEENLKISAEKEQLIGIEDLSVWNEKSNIAQKKKEVREKYININLNHVKSYNDKTGIDYRVEEPVCAQNLYGILDGLLQEVLSNQNADIEKLVKDANQNMQSNYLDYEN